MTGRQGDVGASDDGGEMDAAVCVTTRELGRHRLRPVMGREPSEQHETPYRPLATMLPWPRAAARRAV